MRKRNSTKFVLMLVSRIMAVYCFWIFIFISHLRTHSAFRSPEYFILFNNINNHNNHSSDNIFDSLSWCLTFFGVNVCVAVSGLAFVLRTKKIGKSSKETICGRRNRNQTNIPFISIYLVGFPIIDFVIIDLMWTMVVVSLNACFMLPVES